MITGSRTLLFILVFTASVSLFSQQDSITYTMKHAESKTSGCAETLSSDTSFCVEGYLTWPEITGSTGNNVHKAVLDKLKADIWLEANRHFIKEGFGSSPQDVINTFIKDLTSESKEWDPDLASGMMSYLREVAIYYNSEGIFSFGVYEDGYTGGAHPNSSIFTYNYSLRTGQLMTPEEIFLPDAMEDVLRLAEKQFRKAMELPAKGNINDQGFWFRGGRFHLSRSFLPSKTGLTFIYNPYEVAPYAAGEIRIFLSYTSLKKYISSWGPLSQHAEEVQ